MGFSKFLLRTARVVPTSDKKAGRLLMQFFTLGTFILIFIRATELKKN